MSQQLIGVLNPRRKRKSGGRRRRSAASRAPRRRRRTGRRRAAASAAPKRRRRASAVAAPRRRRRRAFGKVRRRRLHGRRNPGALIVNGGGSILSTIKSAAPIVLGVTGGLVGTRMASNLAAQYLPGGDNPWMRAGIRAGVTLAAAWLLKGFSRKAAQSVLIGGGVSTLEALVQAAAPSVAAQVGLGVIQPAGLGVIQPSGLNGLACGELVAGY